MDLSDTNILLVEDNPQMRQLIRVMLEAVGVKELREAGSGEAGWEALQSWTPDLALVDYMMPGMSGMDLTEMIRSGEPRIARLPVIIVTGHGETSNIRKAAKAGANDFIVKPFTAGVLLGRIFRSLRDPRTISELVDRKASVG